MWIALGALLGIVLLGSIIKFVLDTISMKRKMNAYVAYLHHEMQSLENEIVAEHQRCERLERVLRGSDQ